MRPRRLFPVAISLLVVTCVDDERQPTSPELMRPQAEIIAVSEPVNLTANEAFQTDPAISGNTVVWTDRRTGEDEIFACDISQGLARCAESAVNLTRNPARAETKPSVSGNIVVWQDRDLPLNPFSPSHINGCDVSGGFETCADKVVQLSPMGFIPVVAGRRVAWRAGTEVGDFEVFGCDISGGLGACAATTVQLSPDPTTAFAPERQPGLSGDIVAWDGPVIPSDIFACDVSGGPEACQSATVNLTADTFSQLHPAVGGNVIVWSHIGVVDGKVDNAIVACDVSVGLTACAENTVRLGGGSLAATDGNLLVWWDAGTIMGCDLSDGLEACPTSAVALATRIPGNLAVSGRVVVGVSQDGDVFGLEVAVGGNRAPAVEACIMLTAFVRAADPSPTDCIHSAKVHGYHGANVGGSSDPPSTFPPQIVVRGSADDEDPLGPEDFTWTVQKIEDRAIVSTVDLPSDLDKTVNLTHRLGPGQYSVILRVDDGRGGVGVDQVFISVPELVLLVHGIFGKPESFGEFGPLLGADVTALGVDYSDLTHEIFHCEGLRPSFAEIANSRFRPFVEELLNQAPLYTGHINVVAHSMGGLVVRSYMAGLASPRAYQRGTFRRLMTAGTPNYGATLADWSKAGCLMLEEDPQGRAMVFGGLALATLHQAWVAGERPIDEKDYLAIAGIQPFVEGDNVVKAYSATVPVGIAQLAYNDCSHGFFLPECRLVDVHSRDHSTLQIVERFLDREPGVPDEFTVPPRPLSTGLLLIFFERLAEDGTVQRLGLDDVSLRFKLRRMSDMNEAPLIGPGNRPLTLGCGFNLGSQSVIGDCPDIEGGGVASFRDVPQGPYQISCLSATSPQSVGRRSRTVYRLVATANVTISPGRPSVQRLLLEPAADAPAQHC